MSKIISQIPVVIAPDPKIGKRWWFHKDTVDRWVQNDPSRSDSFNSGNQSK